MANDQANTIRMNSFSRSDNNFTKKASLLAILDQHQSNSYNLEQIAFIFGGAENILRDYLSSNDMLLNDEQLTQIEQIITSQNPIKRTPKSMDEMNDSQSITYTFNKNETYYHYLFNKQTATKIVNTIYYIWWIVFNLCIGASIIIWDLVGRNSWYYVYSLIVRSYSVLYIISSLLTMNRKVFKKSIGHFVFWFKILTCIQGSICYIILNFWIIKQIPITPISLISEILYLLAFNCLILMFCAIDCFQLSRKVKIFIGFAISIVLTAYAIEDTFMLEEEIRSMSTIHFNSWLRLSIGSLYASSSRVLCIFLWKQTILLLLKKGRCVNIRYSPYINWVKD